MADLHCPATVVVARHGEAAFVEDWFSNEGGSLTTEGRARARELGERLRGRRIAAVLTSDLSRAVQTGEIAATALGCGVTARKSLREVFIGDLVGRPFDVRRIEEVAQQWAAGDLDAGFPGGETGHDVLGRHREELDALADLHRGETVLVVGHQTALGLVVPALTGAPTPWPGVLGPPPTGSVDLAQDSAGWRLVGPPS